MQLQVVNSIYLYAFKVRDLEATYGTWPPHYLHEVVLTFIKKIFAKEESKCCHYSYISVRSRLEKFAMCSITPCAPAATNSVLMLISTHVPGPTIKSQHFKTQGSGSKFKHPGLANSHFYHIRLSDGSADRCFPYRYDFAVES